MIRPEPGLGGDAGDVAEVFVAEDGDGVVGCQEAVSSWWETGEVSKWMVREREDGRENVLICHVGCAKENAKSNFRCVGNVHAAGWIQYHKGNTIIGIGSYDRWLERPRQ